MRILFVTPWFPVDEADKNGKFVVDSIQSLIDQGHHITVLMTLPWHPFRPSFTQHHPLFKVYRCRYLSIPRNYCRTLSNGFYRKKVGRMIRQLAKKEPFDLIHAHTELAGLAAAEARKALQLPTLLTLHGIDTDPKLYPHEARYLYQEALNGVDKIILVGQSLLPHFKRWTKRHDIFEIIPNGFWPDEVIPVQQAILSRKTTHFISASNLQVGKGIDITLNALAKLKRLGCIDWRYTVIGDGPSRKQLEELTARLHLQEQIFFLGQCSPQQVSFHLSKADIFVLPSQPEAFGIAYLEAMACGLLAIAVQGQGPSAFITHEKTGLLLSPNNANALCGLLQKVFQTIPRMQAIAAEGKRFVHSAFAWEHHADTLTKLYTQLKENA
ncbi:MAG: glycosyltransferase family 4 protein [Legionella sp.]|nr:glycosyltransferase family 4 protein [Legionella sp.]